MCRKAGIKADRFTAALAKAVRGYEEVPISEIKRRIEAGEFILQGNITDGEVPKDCFRFMASSRRKGWNVSFMRGTSLVRCSILKIFWSRTKKQRNGQNISWI
ncbi:hypothetical protein [Ruminococcus sp.]|uniref:hypothetical protein n=1 Tax=Ruminococcus sp. TaxID=41978 RepID=UPI0025D55B32|nr:hypothetical protein [Ruminococcus sp.]